MTLFENPGAGKRQRTTELDDGVGEKYGFITNAWFSSFVKFSIPVSFICLCR